MKKAFISMGYVIFLSQSAFATGSPAQQQEPAQTELAHPFKAPTMTVTHLFSDIFVDSEDFDGWKARGRGLGVLSAWTRHPDLGALRAQRLVTARKDENKLTSRSIFLQTITSRPILLSKENQAFFDDLGDNTIEFDGSKIGYEYLFDPSDLDGLGALGEPVSFYLIRDLPKDFSLNFPLNNPLNNPLNTSVNNLVSRNQLITAYFEKGKKLAAAHHFEAALRFFKKAGTLNSSAAQAAELIRIGITQFPQALAQPSLESQIRSIYREARNQARSIFRSSSSGELDPDQYSNLYLAVKDPVLGTGSFTSPSGLVWSEERTSFFGNTKLRSQKEAFEHCLKLNSKIERDTIRAELAEGRRPAFGYFLPRAEDWEEIETVSESIAPRINFELAELAFDHLPSYETRYWSSTPVLNAPSLGYAYLGQSSTREEIAATEQLAFRCVGVRKPGQHRLGNLSYFNRPQQH